MNYVLAYIIYLLLFTVGVWGLEALFILFGVLTKNRTYINLVTGAIGVIALIYQVLAILGTFVWLVQAIGLIWAVVVSIFLGSLVYGLFAGVFAFIIRLPAMWLLSWAEDKIR